MLDIDTHRTSLQDYVLVAFWHIHNVPFPAHLQHELQLDLDVFGTESTEWMSQTRSKGDRHISGNTLSLSRSLNLHPSRMRVEIKPAFLLAAIQLLCLYPSSVLRILSLVTLCNLVTTNRSTKEPSKKTTIYPIYFLGLTEHPATILALPPVGVQSRALQLSITDHLNDLLITHDDSLGVAEHSGTIYNRYRSTLTC